jgi:adenosylhomocysteine nucleosidase
VVETLLLITSEERELAGLVRHATAVTKLDWPLDWAVAAVVGGSKWLLLANGPGSRLSSQAAEEAIRRERIAAVVSTGLCGGLDPALQIGDVLTASGVIDADSGESFPATPARQFSDGCSSGLFASCDRVISTAREKCELRERTGAAAVDMESAALARVALRAGLPFHAVRVVSDTSDQSFANDYNAARDVTGRFSKSAVLRAAFRHPFRRVPELFHLARTRRTASSILGDCLAAR